MKEETIKLFDEQLSRKPNRYPWCQAFIESMWEGHWTPREFDFHSDIHDFKTELTDEQRDVIKRTLSAIAQIEVAVKKFWSKLGDNLPHPSINDLGAVMSHVEVIHNLAYEKLLLVLGLDDVFEENMKLDIIQGRVKYLRKYNHKYYKDSKKQYIYSLVLFTLFVENVSLFSQFYIINWFFTFNRTLKDTAKQVAYTAREETIHAQVGIKLINTLREEYPEYFDKDLEERIASETLEAFKCESEIVDWLLGEYKSEQLDGEIIKEFIKDRFNESLKQIGFKEVFETDEEILKKSAWFYDEVLANVKTDIFNSRTVNYTKGRYSFSVHEIFGENENEQ